MHWKKKNPLSFVSQPTVVLVSSDSPKNSETIVTSCWLLWCHTQSKKVVTAGIGRRLQGVKQAALPKKQLNYPGVSREQSRKDAPSASLTWVCTPCTAQGECPAGRGRHSSAGSTAGLPSSLPQPTWGRPHTAQQWLSSPRRCAFL